MRKESHDADEHPFVFKTGPGFAGAQALHAEFRRRGLPTAPLSAIVPDEAGTDYWFTVGGGRLPFAVDLRLGRDQQGRLLVTGLRLDGLRDDAPFAPFEITATALREVGAGLQDVLRYIAEYRMSEESDIAQFVGPELQAAAQPYGGVAMRPGRKGHSPEFYRQVADGYLAALREDPEHPLSLLARRLFRSESQTRRLRNRAWELFPEMKPKDGGAS